MKARFPFLKNKDKICDSCKTKFIAKRNDENGVSTEEFMK